MTNAQEYIESGLLEQYALGELPPAARAAVEAEAAADPAIAAELADVVAALDGYAQAHAVAPPPALRARVLAHVLGQGAAAATAAPAAAAAIETTVSATPEATALAAPAVAPLAAPPAAAAPNLRADIDAIARPVTAAAAPAAAPLLGERPAAGPLAAAPARSWLALAASVALLLSVVGNFFLYNRWHEADTRLVALQADQTRLASANTVLQREASGIQTQNEILRDDRFKVVALAGTPAAPGAKARVFFDPRTRQVYLDARNLPALPAGKQYQLWALQGGKPVDAGMVTATAAAAGLQPMKATAQAQAFALTVEPVGGSAGPTMPIQAMGAVTI